MFLDLTQRRSTVGRTPLDECLARRRDLYLTTHDTHNRQISMPPLGFEPRISAGERPAAARLLRFWVRIPPGAWIFVCCECRVLSGRGLCDELITRPEESYRLCCVDVCDLESSWKRRPWPTGGLSRQKQTNKQTNKQTTLVYYICQHFYTYYIIFSLLYLPFSILSRFHFFQLSLSFTFIPIFVFYAHHLFYCYFYFTSILSSFTFLFPLFYAYCLRYAYSFWTIFQFFSCLHFLLSLLLYFSFRIQFYLHTFYYILFL